MPIVPPTCSQEELTLLLRGSLASQPALPGSEEAQRILDGSGLKLLQLYDSTNLHGSFLRMFTASLVLKGGWRSSRCVLRWKPLVTKSNRLLFRLVPSMPRTNGNGSGLWPTPNARDHKDTGMNVDYEKIKKKCRLAGAIGGPVNPEFSEWLMGFPVGWTDLKGSATRSSRKSLKRSGA